MVSWRGFLCWLIGRAGDWPDVARRVPEFNRPTWPWQRRSLPAPDRGRSSVRGAVFHKNHRQMRMVPAESCQEPARCVSRTVIFGLTVLLDEGSRARGNHSPQIRKHQRCSRHLMVPGHIATVTDSPQAGPAMALVRRKDWELKVRAKRNLVQSQLFSEKLKKTLNAYHNRAISTMQVLEELISLAKEMEAAGRRGEDLGLTDDELAFYDALAANKSAVEAMGDEKLRVIAAELITQWRLACKSDPLRERNRRVKRTHRSRR